MAAMGFTQYHRVVMAVEAESLFNAACHSYLRVAAGDAKAVGEHPHFAGVVFDLKNAISHCAE